MGIIVGVDRGGLEPCDGVELLPGRTKTLPSAPESALMVAARSLVSARKTARLISATSAFSTASTSVSCCTKRAALGYGT